MMLRHGFQSSLLACLFLAAVVDGGAQTLWITSERPDGVYKVNEPIHWKISLAGAPEGVYETSYTLKKNGVKILAQGKLDIRNGQADLEARADSPEAIDLEGKTIVEGKEISATGGIIAAPEKLQPIATCPADFDAFWHSKIDELSKVPTNPQLEAGDSGKPEVEYSKITMDNIRGSHIHGQIARPKVGKKFPAMLIVQWAGVYPLKKEWAVYLASKGWLVLNISAHDLPIDKPADFYKELEAGALKDYTGLGNDNRETCYFLRMFLSCYRAADYLSQRPDWDGKTLLVQGGSQGGYQTIVTAALHPKITAAAACVPAGCDLYAINGETAQAWPNWEYGGKGKDAEKVRETSRYFDAVNFAARVKCPILIGAGLVDRTCPPAGVFAAYDQFTGPKRIVPLPLAGHMAQLNSHSNYYEEFYRWQEALLQGQPVPPAVQPAAKP